MLELIIEEALPEHTVLLAQMWQQIDQSATERPFGGDTEGKEARAKEFIEHAMQSPKATILVAYKKSDASKKIIGTITGHIYERPVVRLSSVGVIYSLWVDKDMRNQGIGQILLDSIEQRLISLGAEAFQVGWDVSNPHAAKWWQKRGFKSYETIASKNISTDA